MAAFHSEILVYPNKGKTYKIKTKGIIAEPKNLLILLYVCVEESWSGTGNSVASKSARIRQFQIDCIAVGGGFSLAMPK